MENTYGVGIVNRYALFLDDESDPLDAIKAQEQAKELRKKSKEAEKENKGKPESKPKTVATTGTAPRKGIKETQNVKSSENRGDGKGKPSVGQGRQERAPTDQRAPGGEPRPPPRRREDRPNGAIEGKDAPRPPRRDPGERSERVDRGDRGERVDRGDRGERVDRGERGERSDRGERGDRGERVERADRGDRGERRPYERRNFDGPEGGERRGPPRGPREPREPREGPRGPRQYDGRGKREFDRRSGSEKTGVKPVDKREGGGAHNWGNHKDDIDELNKTASDGDQVEEKVEAGAGDGQQAQAPAESAPPAEEEPRELTLDEYKALRSAARQKPQYNLRKANEGVDESQWKNLVALEKKKEAGEHDDDSDEEYDMADYPQRVGRQKRVLGIEFTFNDTARRGGAGAGAGRGRGRGRGAPRGRAGPPPREEQPQEERRAPRQAVPPKVDDNKDFPSLG